MHNLVQARGLLWAVFICHAWQCQGVSSSPEGGAGQVHELSNIAGIGEVQNEHFKELKGKDPLKAWRDGPPPEPLRKVGRAESLQNGVPERKAEVTSEEVAARGYHHIPGLTIDSPAIAKMEQATLADCVKACSQVHLCTGVQFSQDLHLKGGNCLIMERRVQFSQTFDYYERPGISEEQVKQMDEEMMNKWTNKDQKETDPDPQDLGGLSTADIPGSTYVDTRKTTKEFKAEEALERASKVIAGINKERETEKHLKAIGLESALKEKQKAFKMSKLQSDQLSAKATRSGAKASRLAKNYEDKQVNAAKLTLRMSESAKKSQRAVEDVKEAESKAQEYMKAGKAYQMAGNPLAEEMAKKFKKWREVLRARKLALLVNKKQRLSLQAQADEQLKDGRELEQQAEWAKADHQDLVKRENAAEQLKKLAFEAQEDKKKQLKRMAPALPVGEEFKMSSSVVTQLRDA